MPNIAVALLKGATPLVANDFVNNVQKKRAEDIFSQLGIVSWVRNDNDIDTITALSGSGPAYVFLFMESMIKAAMALGISEQVAHTLTLQTFNGALELATKSGLS